MLYETQSSLTDDVTSLLLLASVALCGPSATVAAAVTAIKCRRTPRGKGSAAVYALAASAALSTLVIGAVFVMRGTLGDASALLLAIPAGTVVGLAGGMPGALLARWLMAKRSSARCDAGGSEAA